MLNLVKKIKVLWIEQKLRHAHAHEISPHTIGKMAKDLVHLIVLIERGTVLNALKKHNLKNLKIEMLSLEQMTENIDFCRLTANRRLALHASLLKSHDRLLSAVQASTSPTERLQ